MENASKALIIAGAILLSILIIGIGMTIFKQASTALDGANMNSEQIAAYNSVFEGYEGSKKNGSDAQTLVQEINNHNRTEEDDTKMIAIYNSAFPADLNATVASEDVENNSSDAKYKKSTYKTGKTYTISFAYDNNTGLLIAALIDEN